MYCPNCSEYLNPDDKFCGVCGYQIPEQTPNNPKKDKNNKNTVALIISIVAIALAIIGCIVAIILFKSGTFNKPAKAKTEYATFLRYNLLETNDRFGFSDEKNSEKGIASALVDDFDNNGQSEMLTVNFEECHVYEKSYWKIWIDTYSKETAGNDEAKGEIINSASKKIAEIKENDNCDKNFAIYTYEVNGKKYIVVEYCTKSKNGQFDASVYEYSNGDLKLAGSICSCDILVSSKIHKVVYLKNVPKNYAVYNKDTWFGEDSQSKRFQNDYGYSIAYSEEYDDYGNLNKFNSYYQSELEAIRKFYECFGINRQMNNNAKEPLQNLLDDINHLENGDLVVEYKTEYENDKEVYSLTDYTEMDELLECADEDYKQEIPNAKEINVNDDLVQALAKKVHFEIYAYSTLFDYGHIRNGDFDNEMMLRLGFASLENERLQNDDSEGYSDQGYETVIYYPQKIEENIKSIFGEKASYELSDFSLYSKSEHKAFADFYMDIYKENKVYYDNHRFSLHSVGMCGRDTNFIYQQLYKAEEYDDEIKLYFKKSYVEVTQISGGEDELYNYVFYKDFNGSFETPVKETTSMDYYLVNENNEYPWLTTKPTKLLSPDELNQLDCCCYTFKKGDNGKYYLYAFDKTANPKVQ